LRVRIVITDPKILSLWHLLFSFFFFIGFVFFSIIGVSFRGALCNRRFGWQGWASMMHISYSHVIASHGASPPPRPREEESHTSFQNSL